MANILVTQPRRISALSVATRVAEERGECIGEKSRQVIFENSAKIYNQKSLLTKQIEIYIFLKKMFSGI